MYAFFNINSGVLTLTLVIIIKFMKTSSIPACTFKTRRTRAFVSKLCPIQVDFKLFSVG